jgi:predicted transposase YdaD
MESGRRKQVWYEEGMEEGLEKGRVNEQKEIARNALAEGASIEFVHKITGLDMGTIKSLQASNN